VATTITFETIGNIDTAVKNMIADIDELVGVQLGKLATEALEEYGTDANGNVRDYVATVDGKVINSEAQFFTARRKISVRFTQAALNIAVNRMKQIMREQIDRYGAKDTESNGQSWTNTAEVKSAVAIYYLKSKANGGTGRSREINIMQTRQQLPS